MKTVAEIKNVLLIGITRRHRALMESLYGAYTPGFVRHSFPLIVDKEALDSVVEGSAPTEWRFKDYQNPRSHVIVLDMNWFDDAEKTGRFSQADAIAEPDDDGEYGWTKVLVIQAYPYLYSLLINGIWQAVYVRPPKVSCLP